MTRRQCSHTTHATRLVVAGTAVSLGALGLAGQAIADPMTPVGPTQVAAAPDAPPPPGEPVLVADAPPVPGDTPGNFDPSQAVGRVADDQAHYGSGSGPLGFLRDAWQQAKDPYNFGGTPEGEFPTSAPPPGAGPAPQLPPGYRSINAPGSEAPATAPGSSDGVKPPPPPGYVRLADGRLAPDPNGPPPPAAGAPLVDPAAPPAYVPRHSPPPPPLLPENPGPPPF